MLFNLTCVLIYSLKKCFLEDDFKDSCVPKLFKNLQKNIYDRVHCHGSYSFLSCHCFEQSAVPNIIS